MRPRLVLIALIALAPSLAFGGKVYKEWWDCAGNTKLFAVSWKGPWPTFGTLELQNGPSNHGPWTSVLGNLNDADCYFPALNKRWYRVWTLLGGEQGKVWIPLHQSYRLCNVY